VTDIFPLNESLWFAKYTIAGQSVKNGGRNQVSIRPQMSTPTHIASETPAMTLIRVGASVPGVSFFISWESRGAVKEEDVDPGDHHEQRL